MYVDVEFCVSTRLDISFLQNEKVVKENAWLHILDMFVFPQTEILKAENKLHMFSNRTGCH
jgi:hypothetical protein